MIVVRDENRPRTKIGGIYRFSPGTTNEEIIESILRDFCLKLYRLLEEYYDPDSGLNSLCTYEIFNQRWGIPDPGDVSHNGEKIYQEIPTNRCARLVNEVGDGKHYDRDTIARMFDSGEFPSVTIWKGYHQGRDEIHVTYSIGR